MPERSLAAKRRRWYDSEPECTRLVDIIEGIPNTEMRDVAGRLVIHFTERISNTLRGPYRAAPVSLGLPAIQDLYASKRHNRRWYDDDQTLKKAFSGLYALPLPGLSAVGFKLTNTLELIHIYAYACARLEQEPSHHEVQEIIKVSLYEGKNEGTELLEEILGKDLYESLTEELEH
jgi:hypothetical protein